MRLSVSMEVVGKVGISLTVEVSDLDKCNCYRVELQVRGKYSDFECNRKEFFSIKLAIDIYS